ncbi:hypothetical protein [Bacillus sp. Marseille-P3800]|uniref:hypothetical protein n=1 Tax=Bacillus sp. Marseille-P3800 TaxID=2014782 RepID=UPI000C0851E4|nr:hypothetical protein [Bacillus sp. Marseille-P3800]
MKIIKSFILIVFLSIIAACSSAPENIDSTIYKNGNKTLKLYADCINDETNCDTEEVRDDGYDAILTLHGDKDLDKVTLEEASLITNLLELHTNFRQYTFSKELSDSTLGEIEDNLLDTKKTINLILIENLESEPEYEDL